MEDVTNLFLQMESERDKVPHVLREDFVSSFIVSLLRRKLCDSNDTTTLDESNHMELGPLGAKFSVGDKWTDDSFLEDFADVESSLLLENERTVEYVNRVLAFGAEALSMFHVDYRRFIKTFIEEMESPPLELLWLMESKYNLISLSSYLMEINSLARTQFFQQQVLVFFTSACHLDASLNIRSTKILHHILETLVLSSHCNSAKGSNLEALRTLAEDILYQLTTKFVVDMSITYNIHEAVLSIIREVRIPNSVKKRYFCQQLYFIATDPRLKEDDNSYDIKWILQHQEKYANSGFLTDTQLQGNMITAMIDTPITASDVIGVISKSIKSGARNWDKILRIITAWINKVEYEATSAMKDIIKDLMRLGLSSKDEEKVFLAFIFARHCSLVAPKIFSRYEKWYSHMFESEMYSPAKDLDSFQFLANLLIQWIPFEPSCFLQVQATFWPYIPAGGRCFWSDYVSLAKVRVAEYNEVEDAMEFEPNPNNPVLHDVEMTIKAYDSTRTLPQSVAHMWMFRKQYYLDQFLPVLLKKPLGAVLSDGRLRLIEVLNREGKIPSEMYAAYKSSKDSSAS